MTNKPNAAKQGVLANAFALLGVEFLFLLLPFIVLAMIFSNQGEPTKLIYIPEWSLAAAVLFGQTVVKLTAILSGGSRIRRETVRFIIAVLIVLGLVPSLLIMFFVMTAKEPSYLLAIAQISIFILAITIFFILGVVAQVFEALNS